MSAVRYAITTTKNYFYALINAVCDGVDGGHDNYKVAISSQTYKDANGKEMSTGNTSFCQTSRATKGRTINHTDVAASASGIFLMEERNNGFESISANQYKILIDKADIKSKFKEFYNMYQNDTTKTYSTSDDYNPVTPEDTKNDAIEKDYEELKALLDRDSHIEIKADDDPFMQKFNELVNAKGVKVIVTELGGSNSGYGNDGSSMYNYDGEHSFDVVVKYPGEYSSRAGKEIGRFLVTTTSPDATEMFKLYADQNK